jgi:hypothetical protein
MGSELWAALLGGSLSLLGTFLTLWLQQRFARQERAEIVRRFLAEQSAYVREIVAHLDEQMNRMGEVWIEDV